MINLASVLADPVFLQPYRIERQIGAFTGDGEYTSTSEFLDRKGSVQPASSADVVNFVPEGLRSEEAIRIWDKESVVMRDGVSDLPDIIHWQGRKYRVAYTKPYSSYGYYFVIATRFKDGN